MDSGELADYLGYTQRSIYKLIKEEGLPAIRITVTSLGKVIAHTSITALNAYYRPAVKCLFFKAESGVHCYKS